VSLRRSKNNLDIHSSLCYAGTKTVLINMLIIAGDTQFPEILVTAENCCKTPCEKVTKNKRMKNQFLIQTDQDMLKQTTGWRWQKQHDQSNWKGNTESTICHPKQTSSC